MKITRENVNPKIAEKYLVDNIGHNRPVVKSHVAWLASQMEKGHWKENGDTITFADTGHLIDGQHRLHAVIKANIQVPVLIVRGVDEQTFTTKDTGRTRRARDFLGIAGVKNTKLTASVLRLIHASDNMSKTWDGVTAVKQLDRMDGDELLALNDLHPELQHICIKGVGTNTFICRHSRSPVAGFLRYWFHTINPEDAELFYTTLNSGAGLELGDPILTLREKLIRVKTDSKRYMSERENLSYIIRAWNYWRAGQKLHLAKYSETHEFPIPK